MAGHPWFVHRLIACRTRIKGVVREDYLSSQPGGAGPQGVIQLAAETGPGSIWERYLTQIPELWESRGGVQRYSRSRGQQLPSWRDLTGIIGPRALLWVGHRFLPMVAWLDAVICHQDEPAQFITIVIALVMLLTMTQAGCGSRLSTNTGRHVPTRLGLLSKKSSSLPTETFHHLTQVAA